jgi:Ca2+-binding RTX toxin-like protein
VTVVNGIDVDPEPYEIGLTGGDLQGGNPYVFEKQADVDGDLINDIKLTATAYIIDGQTETAETVNYKNIGIGVGTGSSIDGDGLTDSDVLNLAFTDPLNNDPLTNQLDLTSIVVKLAGFDSGEIGYWRVFLDGVEVANGQFTHPDSVGAPLITDVTEIDNQFSTFTVDPGVTFDTIEFLAIDGGNGYAVNSVALVTTSQGFDQTITYDFLTTDGDFDTATGSFDVTFSGDGSLDGSAGPDVLMSDGDADFMYGAGGNDILTGGIGADVFAFSPHDNEGYDTITDFSVTDGDVLKFYDVLDSDLVNVNVVGEDVTLTIDGTSILIEEFNSQPGVNLANATLTLNELQDALPVGTLDYTSDTHTI